MLRIKAFRKLWFALMVGTLLLPAHVLIVPQFILFRALHWVGGPFPYTPLIVPNAELVGLSCGPLNTG